MCLHVRDGVVLFETNRALRGVKKVSHGVDHSMYLEKMRTLACSVCTSQLALQAAIELVFLERCHIGCLFYCQGPMFLECKEDSAVEVSNPRCVLALLDGMLEPSCDQSPPISSMILQKVFPCWEMKRWILEGAAVAELMPKPLKIISHQFSP